MASLIKKGDWFYLQFYSADREPQRKKVPLKTRTKATALTLKRKLEDHFALGGFDPWTDDPLTYEQPRRSDDAPDLSTLGSALAAFLDTKRGCRKTTLDHYGWVLDPFVAFMGEDYRTSDLTWRDVMRWLDTTNGNAQSRHTYNTRIGVFARFLLHHGAIPKDLSKEVPLERVPDKFSAKLITEAHLTKIVETANASSVPYIADVAIVAFDLALRLGEACAMRRSWVDFSRRRLTIQQDDTFLTKNGKDVIKPISARSTAILERWCDGCDGERDHVFKNTNGIPLEPKHTSKMFKKVIRLAGLPETLTFHGLRHGGISRLILNGCSVEAVRRFADHSSIEMTMRYTHLLDDQYFAHISKAMVD